jgi:hypothetical protein
MVQRIKDAKPRLTRDSQNLQHMRYAIICSRNALYAVPYLTALGNEIVVWIDDQQCSDLYRTLNLSCFFYRESQIYAPSTTRKSRCAPEPSA